MKETIKKFTFSTYVWLFLVPSTLLYEAFLHLGTMDNFLPIRFAAILAFGAGFAALLSLVISLFPQKLQRGITAAVTIVLAILYIVQYFIHDAYQVFMSFDSVLNGAEGVATNYLDVVVSLVLRNLWMIALLLLPGIILMTSGQIKPIGWKHRLCVLCAGLLMYGLGSGIVHLGKIDIPKFALSCSFDNAVESFGLNMGLGMDLMQDVMGEQSDFDTSFQTPETEAPTEAPVMEVPGEESQENGETVPETEPPVVYEPHALDLDFAALAESEPNAQVASIHKYIASLTPAMENEFTGLFEGKNLIFITAEAFSYHAVDQERTPALYRMVTEGIYFTDYYQPVWGAGTTGGEYTNLTSMIPYGGSASMQEAVQQDLFHLIGKQLQKQGYASAAFHNNDYTYYKRHETHTMLGYDIYMGTGNGMEEGLTSGWPQSDEEMFRFTIPQYIDQQPFSLYYMTVSGHAHYLYNSNFAARRNAEYVDHLPYTEPVRAYLACNMELEHAMAYLIESLEAKGIADDTVVVIAPDHYPYGLAPSETWGTKANFLAELYGKDSHKGYVRDKSTLIIWSGCLEDMDLIVDTPTQSLDILPTLSNLFGVEYDSRLMCGRDVFSDQQPAVTWIDGSWKTEKGLYDATTGKFTPAEGVEVDDTYRERIQSYTHNKFIYSRAVANVNYFNYVVAAWEASKVAAETQP